MQGRGFKRMGQRRRDNRVGIECHARQCAVQFHQSPAHMVARRDNGQGVNVVIHHPCCCLAGVFYGGAGQIAQSDAILQAFREIGGSRSCSVA